MCQYGWKLCDPNVFILNKEDVSSFHIGKLTLDSDMITK